MASPSEMSINNSPSTTVQRCSDDSSGIVGDSQLVLIDQKSQVTKSQKPRSLAPLAGFEESSSNEELNAIVADVMNSPNTDPPFTLESEDSPDAIQDDKETSIYLNDTWDHCTNDEGDEYYFNKKTNEKWYSAKDKHGVVYYYDDVTSRTVWSLSGLPKDNSTSKSSTIDRSIFSHKDDHKNATTLTKSASFEMNVNHFENLQPAQAKTSMPRLPRPDVLYFRPTSLFESVGPLDTPSDEATTPSQDSADCSPSAYSKKNSLTRIFEGNKASRKITKEHISGPIGSKITRSEKQGHLYVYQCPHASDSSSKSPKWKQMFVLLTGPRLLFFKDKKYALPKANQPDGTPECSLEMLNIDIDECKMINLERPYCLQLTYHKDTFNTDIYLIDTAKENEMQIWKAALSYAKKWVAEEVYTPNAERPVYDNVKSKAAVSSSSGSSNFAKTKLLLADYFTRSRPTPEALRAAGIIKDTAVFGSTLELIYQREKTDVPTFVTRCITAIESRGLTTRGIYRLNGNASVVQKIRCMVDRNNEYDLECDIWKQPDLTSALKLFFRELKEPVLPTSIYNDLIQLILRQRDGQDRVEKVTKLINSIPGIHLSTLKYMFQHLYRVMENSEETQMNSNNLSIVMGMNLLWPPDNCSPAESANHTPDTCPKTQIMSAMARSQEINDRNQIIKFILEQTPVLFASSPLSDKSGQSEFDTSVTTL